MNKGNSFCLYAIIIFIIWTWAITPLWANIVVTVLAALGLLNALDED